jgi:alpha-tubulin suppressor-like RCC1 family protein
MAGLLPLLSFAAVPGWWAQRGVTVANASPHDYAPANQGQLKNIAKAAAAEMDAKLPGGAGDELHTLVSAWSVPSVQTNDFAPLNIGQLKNVVRPFYDRLIAAGLATSYPWSGSSPADDFAVANIGQVKNLFSFEITVPNIVNDPLGNRLTATQRVGSLALEANAIWMWGDPVADGSGLAHQIPVHVSGLGGISSVSGGDRHFAVLRNDGLVLTWGENAAGQLGDGTNSNRTVPAAVPNLANVISVKAGGAHTLALQQDGTVLAWGDNYYGQLGTGDTVGLTTPVPVVGLPSLIQVRQIAAGPYRSMALMADGTVWTWGYDHYNTQNGQDVFSPIPAQVSDLTDVVGLAAGYEHTVAVKSDGSVWAWGSNYSNQIANGYPWWNYQATPFQVPNLPHIIKVAAGFDHTLALGEDGTVWAWGTNNLGELGDATTQRRTGPVQVTGLTNVIAIAATWGYSLAMKSDGTVWAWGDQAMGTLPGSDRHVPQQVVFGLFDNNGNGMDDRWEMEQFGDLNQTAEGDFDSDGISNLQEYLRGTDPRDYFNGVIPNIELISGDNQIGDPEYFLADPFVVRVTNATGQPLVNAPVSFAVTQSWGRLSSTNVGEQQYSSIIVRTDGSGRANAYYLLPAAAADTSVITATAGLGANSLSVNFTATTTTPPPPAAAEALTVLHVASGEDQLSWSIPSGNQRAVMVEARRPDGSWVTLATLTADTTSYVVPANSTASSYRIVSTNNIESVQSEETDPAGPAYAIIDLGTDQEPRVITNNNDVLLGYQQRWQNGKLETLKGNLSGFENYYTNDINDDGTAVGAVITETPERTTALDDTNQVLSSRVVQHPAAAKWPAGQTTPILLPAPTAPYNMTPPGGSPYWTARGVASDSRAGTIDEDGHIFGESMPLNGYQETGVDWLAGGGKANYYGFFTAGFDWNTGQQLGTLALTRGTGDFSLTGENRVVAKARHGTQMGSRYWGFSGETHWSPFLYLNATPQFSIATINGEDVNFQPRTVNRSGLVLAVDASGYFLYTPSSHSRTYTGIVNSQDLRAFNNRQLPAQDANGTMVMKDAPQMVGYLNGRAGLWQQRTADGKYYAITLNQLLPQNSGWDLDRPGDINDSGVIAAAGWYQGPPPLARRRRACLLVPVQFKAQDNEINSGFDPRSGGNGDGGPGSIPWASVVKGSTRDVVKLVMPYHADRIRLTVVADPDQPLEVDVDQKNGFTDGDNTLTLIGLTGTDAPTTATIEAHIVDEHGADTGRVAAKLRVMALPPRTVSLGIYRVADPSATPKQTPPLVPSDETIRKRLNDVFAQAGIQFQVVDSQVFSNLPFDTYTSSKVTAPDGLVQEEEFDIISGLLPTRSATARLILANISGDSLYQNDLPPYIRGDTHRESQNASIVFTTNSGGVSDLVATHELGHLLGLSVATPSDNHDQGPAPSATLPTFGALMHQGQGTDQPGLWISHVDWKVANETARKYSP